MPKITKLIEPEAGLNAAVLMECVPGDLLKSETITKNLASEIGVLLAHVHLEHAEGYEDLTDSSHLSSDPRIPFTMKFKEGLEECKGHLPKSLLATCRVISIKTSIFSCLPTALASYTAIFAPAISLLLMEKCEESSTGLLAEEDSPRTISVHWSSESGLQTVKTLS